MRTTIRLTVAIGFVYLWTAHAAATTPHAPLVRKTKDGSHTVELRPWGKAVVIRCRELGTREIELDAFGPLFDKAESALDRTAQGEFLQQYVTSTAGCWWYKNALAFFDEQEKFLIIRLSHGKLLCVDLDKAQPVMNVPKALQKFAEKRSRELALKMLASKNERDRETGAIVAGQMKMRKAVPRLCELLEDRAYYLRYSGDMTNGTIVLFVRKAARKALKKLDENPGRVVTEVPEKGHVKYDRKKGSYVLVLDEDDEPARTGGSKRQSQRAE